MGAEVFYNVHRWYDLFNGRYLRKDPLWWLLAEQNLYAYVRGRPLVLVDPDGLQTFHCTRPLGAKPGDEKPPPVLNHQYLCIEEVGGGFTCDSTSAAPGAPVVTGGLKRHLKPGVGGNPKDVFNPKRCKKIEPKNPCFETCVKGKWNEARRTYAVGPLGEDCQEYTDRVVKTCRKRCKSLSKP